MKAIVSSKVSVTISMPTGDVTINAGGKNIGGKLSEPELSQIAFRVAELSKGEVVFDPSGQDLIGRHIKDIETLEQQAIVIDSLKTKMSELTEKFTLEPGVTVEMVVEINKKLQSEVAGLNTDKNLFIEELKNLREKLRQAQFGTQKSNDAPEVASPA